MQFPTEFFKALTLIAPTKEVRYYLNGVHFYRTTAGKLAGIATTGAIVLWCVSKTEVEAFEPFTVPADMCKLVLSTYGKLAGLEITAEAVQGIPFTKVQGQFPDVRRVLPMTDPSGESAQFDPDLIGALHKAGKALGSKLLDVAYDGQRAARVYFPQAPDALAVIMPMRNLGKTYARPGVTSARQYF